MAAIKFNSQKEEALYRLVVLLNGSLRVIVTRLEDLAATKVLTPEYLGEMKRLTQRIDTEIGIE